jgi:hypothetical protein
VWVGVLSNRDESPEKLTRSGYALNEQETLITPDKLLPWFRQPTASKWNYSQLCETGQPRVMKTIVDLTFRRTASFAASGI